MSGKLDRKQAIRDFKAFKPACGIYALRCPAAGKVWVELSRNLQAAQTGLFFGLRLGGHINKALQTEWNAHGEAAFEFEVVEMLDSEIPGVAVPGELKALKKRWLAELGAASI